MGLTLLPLLLLSVMLALVLPSDDAEAQTDPPTSGDWNIYDTTTIANQRITLTGDLVVWSGGKLTLTDVDLIFTEPGLGAAKLSVRNNGELVFDGGLIAHGVSGNTYRFSIDSGGKASMDGVTVTKMWHNPSTMVNNLEGGLTIRSHEVTVNDCTFISNDRVAMTIIRANPTITNSTFKKTAYYTYSKSGSNLYREAYGVVALDAAPKITGCVFMELGDYSTAYNDATSYYSTYLRLNGHGVYASGGSPKIVNCHFEDISHQHSSYSFYTNVPGYGYVRFYFWNEDYRGAIRAINPVLLEVIGCNFTGNFGGYEYYTRLAYGIYQLQGRSTIKNCIFLSNGGSMIYASQATMIIKDTLMADFQNYGVYIYGANTITTTNVTINGTVDSRGTRYEYGVYFYNAGGEAKVEGLNITFCRYGLYVQDTIKVVVRDTYINNCTKKIWASSSRVDCYNVTVKRADIELGWSQAEVNIFYGLDVLVTWQNGIPIPRAIVQIFNDSNGLLKANKVDDYGSMPTLTMLQTKMVGTSNSNIVTVNSPLKISAYANATESERYTVPFESNTFYQCIIVDLFPPNVEIYFPKRDHAQNMTTLVLYGIAVDVGSGLHHVEVSPDGEVWHRAFGGLTWNITVDLEEGVYDVQVRGVDVAGSISTYTIRNVTIDLTKPWLVITSPKKDFIFTNQTTVTIIGQAEIGSMVYLNGEKLNTQGGQFFTQISDQQEGLNTYEVMAIDTVGNRNISLLRIFQDITPPILLVEYPPEQYVTNRRVLDISGLTEMDVIVKINGLKVVVENGLFTMPMVLEEGLNAISIEAVDLARNFKRANLRITYDITPPNVVMGYPVRDEPVNHSTIYVTGSVDPDVAQVRVNQVPVTVRDNSFTKNFKLSEGDNLIVVEVTDRAGNTVSRQFTLTLDTEAPMLELDTPADGTWTTKETIRVSGRVEVGAAILVDGVEVAVSGGYFVYDAPIPETPPGSGPHLLEVKAIDRVGNEASHVLSVFRDTSPPSFTVFTIATVTRSDFINITGSVSEPRDVALLTINDAPVQPKADGYFEAFVPLAIGENIFVITSVDAAGNEVTQEVIIDRQPLKVRDEGIMGLGNLSWLVLVLFLTLGVALGMAGLYIMDRRKDKEVVA